MKTLYRRITRITKNRRTKRLFTRLVSIVAALVVFTTTYLFVLPAITMERVAGCGIEEHQHDESCYEERLVCGQEETPGHHHTDECYEKVFICGKEEHIHSKDCYGDEAVWSERADSVESAGNLEIPENIESAESAELAPNIGSSESGEYTGEASEGIADTDQNSAWVADGSNAAAEAGTQTAGEAGTEAAAEAEAENYGGATGEIAGEAGTEAATEADAETSGRSAGEIAGEAGTEAAAEADAETAGGTTAEISGEAGTEAAAEADTETVGGVTSENAAEESLAANVNKGDTLASKKTDAQIRREVLTAAGNLYEVTVTCSQEADIPDGSELVVEEFDRESAEYKQACQAVRDAEAEQKNQTGMDNESAQDENMDAFDISIVSPEQEVVEPMAPVQVKIVRKELPEEICAEDEDASEKDVSSTEETSGVLKMGFCLYHLNESTGETVVELVASDDREAEGTVEVCSDAVVAEYEAESFSTHVFSYYYTTVHYGYMEGNHFIEFTDEQFTPPTSGYGSPAYLIYDVPGYQYAGNTYYSTSPTEDMGSWGVRKMDPVFSREQGRHIYVTYKPRPQAVEGGHFTAQGDYPAAPVIEKKSVENPNTGTNTISLEATGPQKTSKHKADIIIIYDVSGSMKFRLDFDSSQIGQGGVTYESGLADDNDEEQRNNAVKKALKRLATELMENNSVTAPEVRMGIVPFSTTAGEPLALTGNLALFKTEVDSLQLAGGTNWEDALQTANAMEVRTDADTYVVFVTDGDPTFRVTRGEVSDSEFNTSFMNAPNSDINADLYRSDGVFGTGNIDEDKTTDISLQRDYNAAEKFAEEIVGKGKNLYGLGISHEAGKLDKLIKDSTGTSDQSFLATSPAEVDHAINEIKTDIREITFGYSDVKINDGITALTQTVQKTGMTTLPASDDFEYYKGREATQEDVSGGLASTVGEVIWQPWTAEQMTAEGAGRANYNASTGAVEWNLGETFMLEGGVHYKVDFTVWPSQQAYDMLADLNNGISQWVDASGDQPARIVYGEDVPEESLPVSGQREYGKDYTDQIGKPASAGAKYTLKTNEDSAGYTYKKATKTDDTVTPVGEAIPGTFPSVDPLHLESNKIGVKKDFNNLLDSRDPTQIQLELWGGGRHYKTFELTSEGNWTSDDNYISCGLLTVDKGTGELYVYETGHDFTLKESGDDAIYWELTADTYHPMVINDQLRMLSKTEAPEGMGDDEKYYKAADDKEYYRIGAEVYMDEGGDALLKAVNNHRSFLDFSKVVVDDNNTATQADDLFEFKASFNESRTDDDIIFTIYDTVNRTYIGDQNLTTAVLTYAEDPSHTRPYFVVSDNTEFTFKIRQGWNVRFLNLSNDTTYSIEEVLGADSDYEFVQIVGSAAKSNGNGSSVSVDPHMSITEGNVTMTGTIFEPNVLYSIQYSNRAPKKDIRILKTDQTGELTLSGAKFFLYGDDYYKNGQVNAAANPIREGTSNEAGIIDFQDLSYGVYYLVEDIAPADYIKLDNPVKIVLSSEPEYDQDNSSLSESGDGVQPLKDENDKIIGYQFTVINQSKTNGFTLPATGGPGTTLITILGLLLVTMGAAGALLRSHALRRCP